MREYHGGILCGRDWLLALRDEFPAGAQTRFIRSYARASSEWTSLRGFDSAPEARLRCKRQSRARKGAPMLKIGIEGILPTEFLLFSTGVWSQGVGRQHRNGNEGKTPLTAMSTILRDTDIERLIGTVIVDGDESCIRPNSYILRLGSEGEFLSVGKEFALGQKKKGLKLQPGHAVGMTAFETVEFRPETVQALFPGKALHGLLTPTTDLAREGVVTPTGQVDCG